MNSLKIVKTCILLIAFFGLFVTFSHTAHALTISPPRLELSGDPGDLIKENLTLTNEKNVTQKFFLSFENFEAQGESGTPSFVEPKSGLGTWMSAEPSVSLLPGESKIIPFTIKIPENAEAGGHFASVFWGTSPSGSGGGQVSIGAKVGTLILLSVSGDIKEEAGLLSFNTLNNKFFYKTLPVSFEYRFKNDGNDRIKPVGNALIRNTLFIPTEKIDANISLGNVLPGSTRKYDFKWLEYERDANDVNREGYFGNFIDNISYQWKNFAVGLYSANLKLAYGINSQEVSKTVLFFVFPWELVLVMLFSLFIIYFFGGKIIRKYNRYIIEKARNGMKIS
ncbi:MAG: hypothetical protein WC011_02570 [Candidatus Paceibacterota bacterium]